MITKKLSGKVAVVTGASKGIGASIAKHLAAEGAAVVVNYASSKSGAETALFPHPPLKARQLPRMDPHKPTKDERDFVGVVKFATALSLGVMAGFLYSLKQVHPTIELECNLGTALAFLITAVFSWLFCGVLFRGEFNKGDSAGAAALTKRRVTRWIVFFFVVSGLAMAGAFLYSLKNVSAQSRREVIEGAGIATVFLTIGGFLIHKTVRFFEEQDKVSLEQRHEDEDHDD
jgi:hypothetical protein